MVLAPLIGDADVHDVERALGRDGEQAANDGGHGGNEAGPEPHGLL